MGKFSEPLILETDDSAWQIRFTQDADGTIHAVVIYPSTVSATSMTYGMKEIRLSRMDGLKFAAKALSKWQMPKASKPVAKVAIVAGK